LDLLTTLADCVQYLLDLSMAVVGLLMFGDGIRDEVSSNVLKTKGYPQALSVCLVVFVSIVPLTKVPLKSVKYHFRPLIELLLTYACEVFDRSS